jgi:hypothetical protein
VTTRLKGVVVAFDHDIREDDAEILISAIRMLRCVQGVQPIEATSDDWIVESRVRSDLEGRLLKMLREKP